MNIKEETKQILSEVIRWRRDLHRIPEIGFELNQTKAYIWNVLSGFGLAPEEIGGGIIADIKGTGPGMTVALRADMDALPVAEETGLEFASVNGNMHACGHDAHSAALLGTAKLLLRHKKDFSGCVRFIFQPAEELGTGAKRMIEAGVLDGVDEILGAHVGGICKADAPGVISFKSGRTMSCMDRFIIEVRGAGAHGSAPEKAIDPIVAASNIVTALQTIVSRELDPIDSAVVSVCRFHAGNAFNVIPDSVQIEGTIRAFTGEIREHLSKSIERIASDIAAAYRAKILYRFLMQPPPVINDPDVTKKAFLVGQELYGEDARELQIPSMVGEDFSWYLEHVPGTYFFLNNLACTDGKVWQHHTSRFDLQEQYLDRVSCIMAAYVLKYMAV